jgi:hypothetical protein
LAIFECSESALAKKAAVVVHRWKRNSFSDNGLRFHHWRGVVPVAPRAAQLPRAGQAPATAAEATRVSQGRRDIAG